MLDAPRLLLERARDPLYALGFPVPMAFRLAPGRDMSRLPTRLGPLLTAGRLAVPAADVEGRLAVVGRLALLEAPRFVAPGEGLLPLRLLF